jgi:hypothetical protein
MFSYDETSKMRGCVDIKVFGPDGTIKDSRYIPNLVVQNGKNYIATRILGTSTLTAVATTNTLTSCMTHMGIGSSSSTVVDTNTTLTGEIAVTGDINAYTRATITSSTQNTGIVTYVATFGINNPGRVNSSNTTGVTEAGIFNASTVGTMLCRTVFNVVNKGNDDTLQITWTITVS